MKSVFEPEVANERANATGVVAIITVRAIIAKTRIFFMLLALGYYSLKGYGSHGYTKMPSRGLS